MKKKILLGVFLILILILVCTRDSFTSIGYSHKESPYTQPKVYPNLITETEGKYILSKSTFTPSNTVSGLSEDIRKSETSWIPKTDPVYNNILDRLSVQFKFDKNNVEDLQVVKYSPGGYYKAHHDSCCDDSKECKEFTKNIGTRVLTILIYLNDAFTGGSTKFPELNLDIKPPKYSGIVFYPMALNENKCHPLALHTGTPIITGTKYVCNIWVHRKL
jgi:prolyl 4-hydroxylase